MKFFLKLRRWELLLMLALPTALCLMFSISFKPLIASTVGLFVLLVLFMWMLSIGIWYTASQMKALLESKDADYMIFSNAFFMLFIFPLGVWPIQPGVNQLYHQSPQSVNADDDA